MTLESNSDEFIEKFRRKSIKKTCPNCSSYIKTKVRYVIDERTHKASALCALICMCCIPYFIKWFQTAEHYCPICDALLGKYPNK